MCVQWKPIIFTMYFFDALSRCWMHSNGCVTFLISPSEWWLCLFFFYFWGGGGEGTLWPLQIGEAVCSSLWLWNRRGGGENTEISYDGERLVLILKCKYAGFPIFLRSFLLYFHYPYLNSGRSQFTFFEVRLYWCYILGRRHLQSFWLLF